MGYFPSNIPFMSEEELKENGITIPKDTKDKKFPIDVYIYSLDLGVEKPIVKKIPAQVREGTYGDEVIYWVGLNDYKVWHSEFDVHMLGVVYMPLDNVIELITKRDDSTELEDITKIESFCTTQISHLVKLKNIFHKGISATIKFSNRPRHLNDYLISTPVSREEFMQKASFSAPWPGPFEGEEDN